MFHDVACDDARVRPISVTGVFWRLWGSAKIKHASTQRWLKAWTPNDGTPHRGCHTAEAFDRVHPRLALQAFHSLGMFTTTPLPIGPHSSIICNSRVGP